MTGPVFVDTNVFVYLHDDSEPEKRQRADDWIEFLVSRRAGRLSFQVLQELYAVLTRTVKETLSSTTARAIVRDLMAWRPIPIDLSILERAWAVQQRYTLSWWDSLIVAAAQSSQCKVVLGTEAGRSPCGPGVGIIYEYVKERYCKWSRSPSARLAW